MLMKVEQGNRIGYKLSADSNIVWLDQLPTELKTEENLLRSLQAYSIGYRAGNEANSGVKELLQFVNESHAQEVAEIQEKKTELQGLFGSAVEEHTKTTAEAIDALQKNVSAQLGALSPIPTVSAIGDAKCTKDTFGQLALDTSNVLRMCISYKNGGKSIYEWVGVGGGSNSEDNPAKGCHDVNDRGWDTGVYWVTDGTNTIQAYCDNDLDGGGWMLVGTIRYQTGGHRRMFQELFAGSYAKLTDPKTYDQGKGKWKGMTKNQRWGFWSNTAKKKEYRWDSYKGSSRLFSLTNSASRASHRSNMIYCASAGCNPSSSWGPFGNRRIESSYKILASAVGDLKVGSSYGVWSLGAYGCDCSESYHINGDWGNRNARFIFGDEMHHGRCGRDCGATHTAMFQR